jgi:hypothetical protein
MSALHRLRDTGPPETRALLRAGADVVPPVGLAETVRRGVEQRTAPRRRARARLWLGLGLLTGTAFAFGAREVVRRGERSGPTSHAARLARGAPVAPTVIPLASVPAPEAEPVPRATPPPAGEAPAPGASASSRHRAAHSAAGPRDPRPTSGVPAAPAPGVLASDAVDRIFAAPDDARPKAHDKAGGVRPGLAPRGGADEALVSPAERLLRIGVRWEGRKEVSLAVTGSRVHGQVRGAVVDLEVKPALLEGHIGGERVLLWLRREEASGTIGGRDVAFVLTPTQRGHILRGNVPGHGVRLELASRMLSFLPGCERDLLPLPEVPGRPGTTYQGLCPNGRRLRVHLPPGWYALPELPRLIVLGMLLTEKEDILRHEAPRLLPPPEDEGEEK